MKETEVTTPEFRVNYPSIFKPIVNKMSDTEKLEYRLEAIFPKGADLSKLKAAAKAALEKRWPDPKTRPTNLRSPFRPHSDKENSKNGRRPMPEGYEEGGFFVNMKSEDMPTIVDQNVKKLQDPTEIYSGCWCKAHVNAGGYDFKGNRGVAFYLQMVQKVRDDEPLTSRPKPEECFAPISGGAEEDSDASEASDPFTS